MSLFNFSSTFNLLTYSELNIQKAEKVNKAAGVSSSQSHPQGCIILLKRKKKNR